MTSDENIQILESPDHFLLQVCPKNDSSIEPLKEWICVNRQFLIEKIALYGGIYFKGFDIHTAEDFEMVAKLIEPDLCDKHPFNGDARTWTTKYTYEVASPAIKKSLTPRAFHNEDSYISYAPSKIMFCCLEPASWGGETLLADCRKVFDSLPDKLKKKFMNKTVESKLILHDEVFLVNSRIPKNIDAIMEVGKSHYAEQILRLSEDVTQFVFRTPVVVKSDVSDSPVWFNLLHLPLHLSCQLYVDTWLAYSYMKGFLNKVKACGLIARAFIADLKFLLMTRIKKQQVDEYILLGDEKISMWERIQINLAFWKNAAIFPLKKGDLVVLDNRLIAHARMPYVGRRVLLSCMGSLTRIC